MTDQELIQLLHEKPPSDFTPFELDALRRRWTQSPELRQALVEHLHLETQLAGALNGIALDVDSLLKRASQQKRLAATESSRGWQWLIGLCLLGAVIVGGTLWIGRPPERDPDSVAKQDHGGNATESDDTDAAAWKYAADALKPANVGGEVSAADAVATALGEQEPLPTGKEPMPEVKPVVAEVAPVIEPWTAALSRAVAPWPVHSPKLTRDFMSAGHDELPETEAKRWFSPVEGQPFTWAQDVYGAQHKRVARFQGLARLRAPWTDETLLRLTPFEMTDFTLYFWRGPQGVALRFYTRREPHQWAAFAITRENSAPKPLRWGLLTSDNGSYVRAGAATFDLRHQDGGLTLARGGISLLTAPMTSVPDEVYIEGQFRLRGISIHKSAPLPSLPENEHPRVMSGAANTLPWSLSAELPAELNMHDNGSVSLTTTSATKVGIASVPIVAPSQLGASRGLMKNVAWTPRPSEIALGTDGRGVHPTGLQRAEGQLGATRGLYEVIARVESADPGTGLFLGDSDGRPLHRVGFFKDTTSQQIMLGVLRPGEQRDTANFDPNAFAPPYHTPQQWIKIVAGLGVMQILVSGDGRSWGHLVENPARDLIGPVATIGLFAQPVAQPGVAPRSIRLSHLEVRELTGVTSFAERPLLAQSPQFASDELKDLSKWTQRTLATQPVGVALPRWFSACAVAALSQGPAKELGVPLLRRLVAVGVGSEASLEQKLRLLDDAALLSDLWDEAAARIHAGHYETLAEQMASTGDLHPLATLRPAILRSPMWTLSKLRFAWERQNSRELLLTAYCGDWADAWQSSQTALFWNTGVHPDWKPTERSDDLDKHARWLKAISIENLPQLDDGTASVFPGGWRHPLAMQWNKEAYNVRSELQSALVGQTYEDACRIVMSIGDHDGPGMLPDMEDRQLFVSLPTAIAGAMQAHPAFAKMMTEKFGPLGQIRVRSAINASDVRGVQAATLQFFGTEAAAEAHEWLGDLDLAAGHFPAAEEHFLMGLKHASARQCESLTARLQLATALNGQQPSSPIGAPTKPIKLSGTTIPPAAFDSLIRDLSARPSASSRFVVTTTSAAPPLVPAAFKLEARAQFDGQPGNNPGRAEFRFGDPFARQLSVVTDAQRLFVSNRFQVNAYALPGGQQQWAQGLGAEQGDAYGLPFAPMKPLIAGDRLYVRRLTKAGAELACLQCDNGHVLWKQRPNSQVLTDPVFWNGSLFALTLAKVDDDLVQIEATRFDFETGAATSSQPLFRMKDQGERSLVAQLTLAGRVAVCTLGGTTACFDSAGEVQWLRRHTWLPKVIDELAEDFRVFTPVVRGDRIVVSIPGVRAVSCLNLATGRLIWERPICDLRGAIMVSCSRVLVETTTGLTALSLDDGTVAWSQPLDARLEAIHAEGHVVIVAHRAKLVGNKSKPFLMWLDLNTGRELAQSQVEGVERDENQLGPLVFAAGKWWTFAGQGWKDPKRELNELVASSPLVPGPFGSPALGAWQPDIIETQLTDFALILPGWSPATGFSANHKLVVSDQRGETAVLSSKLVETHDIALVGQFEIPAGRKTTLRLRVGNQPDKRWQLGVRVENQLLLDRSIEETGSANGWHDIVVDLSPFAGRTIPVQLLHAAPKQHQTEVFWKRAVVVVE